LFRYNMSIESPDLGPRKQHQGGGWRGLLRRFGLGAVESSKQNGENGSVTRNGHGADETRPTTVAEVLADLDRRKAAEVPDGLPTPFELGSQEYPGTDLWQTTKTPEDYAAGLRALKTYDPPHALAERKSN
jgi:hypothetical protein